MLKEALPPDAHETESGLSGHSEKLLPVALKKVNGITKKEDYLPILHEKT